MVDDGVRVDGVVATATAGHEGQQQLWGDGEVGDSEPASAGRLRLEGSVLAAGLVPVGVRTVSTATGHTGRPLEPRETDGEQVPEWWRWSSSGGEAP